MLNNMTAQNLRAIVQSDATIYDPPLVGLLVTLDGTLVIRNDFGDLVTIVLPAVAAGGSFPTLIPGRVRQVMDTNTTIVDANIHGLTTTS